MKNTITAAFIAAFALSVSTALWAEETEGSNGFFYVGGNTGYFKSDGDRGNNNDSRSIGNSRTLGVTLGRQFNDKWAAEYNHFVDAGSPGSYNMKAQQINIIRFWGTDTRFLVNFGLTDINIENMDSDQAFHIGAGLSAFLTDNLELRGDLKLMYIGADGPSDWILSDRNNESYLEGIGTVSLNWYFGREKSVARSSSSSVLGASHFQPTTLPPIQQREPIETEEPASVVESTPPAAKQAVSAAPAVAKSSHVLVNFNSNSIDVEAQYGTQLNSITNEIVSSNSRAVVEGHTDSQGSEAYNKILSMDRAIIVKRELTKRGVKDEDLTVVGHGESRPIASNDTEEGRKQNRRVEVKVYDKE